MSCSAKPTFGVKEVLDFGLGEIRLHNFGTKEQEFVDRLLDTSIVSSLCDGDCSEERRAW